MKFEINQIVSCKVSSGEEFIAKIKSEITDHGFIVISEPVSVAPAPNGQGLGLIPSMFTADPKGEYRLNTNCIVMLAKTDDAIKNKYIEVTTGVKLPDKKIILG